MTLSEVVYGWFLIVFNPIVSITVEKKIFTPKSE